MLIRASGAYPRHFFFYQAQLCAGLLSVFLNCIVIAFLWAQSFHNFNRTKMFRTQLIEIYITGVASSASKAPRISYAVARPSTLPERVSASGPSYSDTSSPGASTKIEPPETIAELKTEPLPNTIISTDNASLALPSQLDFPFQLRGRGLFEPPSGARSPAPAVSENYSGEQQFNRQRMRSELQRNMIHHLLGDLNKDAKPEGNVTCHLRPKASCDRDYLPALEIIRRYEGFFSQSDIKENFFLFYKDGSWSVETKR